MRTKRYPFVIFLVLYGALALWCVQSLIARGDLSLGRHPVQNLKKTFVEMSHPSFFDAWEGNEHFEFKSDDGTVLRTENRKEGERNFLAAIVRAVWTTIRIATLGSILGAIFALPLGLLTAKNLGAPKALSIPAKFLLDCSRSIHTLIFGLFFVGIIGLGPTAGILAICFHSLGTYGKLYAETIETLDMGAIEAVRAVGADPFQTFFFGVWPAVIPQFVSINLYIWEYNIRDSTILGLIGAGGLGLLVSESISLFQWGRLSTLLLVIIAMVVLFDSLSRRLRQELM